MSNENYFKKMMEGIPNFRNKSDSMKVCENCEKYNSIENRCIAEKCIHLASRVRHEAVSTKEMLTAFSFATKNIEFLNRVEKLRNHIVRNLDYVNRQHEALFENLLASIDYNNKAMLSAVYVISSEKQLYMNFQNAIHFGYIRLSEVEEPQSQRLQELSELVLTYECGGKYFSYRRFADNTVISDSDFFVICMSIIIRKFGLSAIHKKG